jgi:hypothetical protein
MANTLLLDNTTWDLLTDSAGNIAMATEPYALSQDVASAIKLYKAELWYDVAKGIPYFEQIWGKSPPINVFKEYMVAAALTVPGVLKARCVIASFSRETRNVDGTVFFIDQAGNEHKLDF